MLGAEHTSIGQIILGTESLYYTGSILGALILAILLDNWSNYFEYFFPTMKLDSDDETSDYYETPSKRRKVEIIIMDHNIKHNSIYDPSRLNRLKIKVDNNLDLSLEDNDFFKMHQKITEWRESLNLNLDSRARERIYTLRKTIAKKRPVTDLEVNAVDIYYAIQKLYKSGYLFERLETKGGLEGVVNSNNVESLLNEIKNEEIGKYNIEDLYQVINDFYKKNPHILEKHALDPFPIVASSLLTTATPSTFPTVAKSHVAPSPLPTTATQSYGLKWKTPSTPESRRMAAALPQNSIYSYPWPPASTFPIAAQSHIAPSPLPTVAQRAESPDIYNASLPQSPALPPQSPALPPQSTASSEAKKINIKDLLND